MTESNPSNQSRLSVSLVIPVRNETKSLPTLIESLQSQTYPPAEAIIVDGGSTDETVALARSLTEGDARFRIIEAGPATPGRGRNVGIAASTNEWVALTDAGIKLEDSWLENLVRVVETDSNPDVIYGNYEPIINSWFERCAALAYVPPKTLRSGSLLRGPSVTSMLLRQNVWRSVGGFPDLRAAEDLIFMERIEQKGFRLGWAPAATVRWNLQPTPVSTFRKFALYSKHNVWAGRQHDWHYGIARQYALWAAFVLLAILTHNPWWLLVIAFGFALRTIKSIWRRRENRGLFWAFNPLQIFGVCFVLMLIDVATFVGWIDALRKRPTPQPLVKDGVASNS